MSYPKSPKTCKRYAEQLERFHGKKFIPIRREKKIKEPFQFIANFAAVTEEELADFLNNGWKVID